MQLGQLGAGQFILVAYMTVTRQRRGCDLITGPSAPLSPAR